MQVAVRIARHRRQEDAFIFPIKQVGGGIAGNADDIHAGAAPGLVAVRQISLARLELAIPLVGAFVIKHPAAMHIDRLAGSVSPDLARRKCGLARHHAGHRT